MRRGLNGAEDGLLLKNVNKNNNKNYPMGENRARLGKAGSAHNWGTYDELAQDCKHKENIKEANEEGNKWNTGGEK